MAPHIMNDFIEKMKYDLITITVEKDTKKAVQKATKQVEAMSRENRRWVVEVDATNVKSPERFGPLVALSIHLYRNIRSSGICGSKILLSEDFSTVEIQDADRELFKSMISIGGSWEDLSRENVDWVKINAVLVDELDRKIEKLLELRQVYEGIVSKAVDKEAKLELQKQLDFDMYQHDIWTLYRRCFDPVDVLLAPNLCYNPNPSFQRGLVWSTEKKQRFIESILNDVPIGAFYVNRPKRSDLMLGEGYGGLLWDGKQRIHALHEFLMGQYPIFVDGKLVYYYDYPMFFSYKFEDYRISLYISKYDNLRDVIKAYVLINSAQVKHTDEDLHKAIQVMEDQSNQA